MVTKKGTAEQFHKEMHDLYWTAGKATGYYAHYYLRGLRNDKHGGLHYAKALLATGDDAQEGLWTLAGHNRLDLSVESLILQDQWSHLFTDKERKTARARLEKASGLGLEPGEFSSDEPLFEGRLFRVKVNAYERNPEARKRCIKHHGARCCVCEFDFGKVYGPLADGFITVHHIKPLSTIRGRRYKVDPIKDLVPVCPNCHAVIHLGGETRSIKEVRKLLGKD